MTRHTVFYEGYSGNQSTSCGIPIEAKFAQGDDYFMVLPDQACPVCLPRHAVADGTPTPTFAQVDLLAERIKELEQQLRQVSRLAQRNLVYGSYG